MTRSMSALAVLCLTFFSRSALAQGEAALPFLHFSPSPEANGMAGTSVAIRRADPTGAIFAPAQIGMLALTSGIRLGFYPVQTEWSPFNAGITYNAWGTSAGLLLNDIFDLPLKAGVGLAYHRVNLDLGEFVRTGSGGPDEIGRYEASENASGLTFGAGIEYFVRFGFGYTFRWITSHLSPIGGEQGGTGSGEADVNAADYSLLLEIPLISLAEQITGGTVDFGKGVRPLLDFSGGLAWNNVGDKVVYVDEAQADPLPRTARAGIAMRAGVIADQGGGWELVSLVWSREAEDLLVVRRADGTWEYLSGLGDIEIGNNVFQGQASEEVSLRSGWQIQIGEIFSYREGSIESLQLPNDTKGYTVQLAGWIKVITQFTGGETPGWLLFARDHVDVQYHFAEYESGRALPEAQSFSGLTLAFHGWLW